MKTIFVIEPDQILCKAYSGALEAKDRQIFVFRTANLAVRALEKVIPDIVVIEIALPVHNGFEFLYEMLSYSDTRSTKVVINSLIRPDDILWGFINRGELNIIEHLYKPFSNISELVRVVDGI